MLYLKGSLSPTARQLSTAIPILDVENYMLFAIKLQQRHDSSKLTGLSRHFYF